MLEQNDKLIIDNDNNFLFEWFDILESYNNKNKTFEEINNNLKSQQLQSSYNSLANQQREIHRLDKLREDKLLNIASKQSSFNIPNPHNYLND